MDIQLHKTTPPLIIPSFVINLKRRPDRLALFTQRCPLEDVFLVPGFDAKDYSGELSEDIDFFSRVKCKFPGESAVYISHMRIFHQILENNYAYGLIFEDDVEFCNGFLERYDQILKEVPSDTYILYIGGRFKPFHRMNKFNCSAVSEHIVKHKIHSNLSDQCDTDRTAHAYIISNSGARVLLEYFYSLETITFPFDDLMLNFFLKNNIPVYNSLPLLCHSPIIGDSDIRHPKTTGSN